MHTAILGAAFPFPVVCRRGQVGLREVNRQSHNSQLVAAQVTLNPQFWGWGNCAPHEEKVQHLLGRTKSPVACPGLWRSRVVTAQEGRQQVGRQSLRAVSLDAPHHAGLIPVRHGHTFPLEWNTSETRVRGDTKDSRKAGSVAQTESPGIQDSGKEEGQESPSLELGHCYLC